jgi:hypothetical protein
MRTYLEFDTGEAALDYRHVNGTGGWVFVPTDGGPSVLFPPDMPPIEIFNHEITRNRSGDLIGNA